MDSPQNNEDSFMNRLQSYISNLEYSNSSLETQLLALKNDLLASNSLSLQLQDQNASFMSQNEESESRKRLLDVFLELRLQEKEIFIKNIEFLLTRLQREHAKETGDFEHWEKNKEKILLLQGKTQEMEMENKHLKEKLIENEKIHIKERDFFKETIKSLEGDFLKEKEKSFDLQRKLSSLLNEKNALKQAESSFPDEKANLEGNILLLEEQKKELEALSIARKGEIEGIRVFFEETIKRYEEEAKTVINEVKQLKEDKEKEAFKLELSQKELSQYKIEINKTKMDYEERIMSLSEELSDYKAEEALLKGISFTTEEKEEIFKGIDKEKLLIKLQKGFLREKTHGLNLKQVLSNMKRALSEKYEVLYQKYEEWTEFTQKHEELKRNYAAQNLRIRDLVLERDQIKLELKEIGKKANKIESEKDEIKRMLERVLEKAGEKEFVMELIEKNLEFRRRFEEIYQEAYYRL